MSSKAKTQEPTPEEIEEITLDTWDEKVLKSDLPCLVHFFNLNEATCKLMDTILRYVARDYKDKVTIVKIDTEDYYWILEEVGIIHVPTMILYHREEEICRTVKLEYGESWKNWSAENLPQTVDSWKEWLDENLPKIA